MPLFSIVIPTYNRPEFLERGLRSLLDQDFTVWEALVIDDGSDPPVADVVKSAISDPRIEYYWQFNQGPSIARAWGSSLARGEWLLYLDDDDWYEPNHLSILAGYITTNPNYTGLLATGMVTRRVDGAVHKEPLFTSSDLPLKQYWQRSVSLLPFAIHRAAIKTEYMPARSSPIEDFEWLCQLLSHYPLQQLPEYTVVYVEHQQNRTVTLIDPADLQHRLDVVRRVYANERVSSQVSRSLLKQMLTHQCWHHARQCLKQRQMQQALASFTEGMRTMNWRSMPELAYTLLSAGRALGR